MGRHGWFENFLNGPSLQVESNQNSRFEFESNLEASQVPTRYCCCCCWYDDNDNDDDDDDDGDDDEIEWMTGASVGESRSIRTEQLIFLEVYRWTRSTWLSPAYTHRFHIVDHTTASGPADRDSGRVETAVVTYVSVTQCLASIWPTQHSRPVLLVRFVLL